MRKNFEAQVLGPSLLVSAVILGIAGGALLLNGGEDSKAAFAKLPGEQAFIDDFIGKDDCIDGSVYDPQEGAQLHVDVIEGTTVFSAIPRDANFQEPAGLFFVVDGSQLSAGDYKTGAFLASNNCPGQSEGY